MTPSAPSYYKYTSWDIISRVSLRARRQVFRRFMSELKPTESEEIVDVGVTKDNSRPESNFFEALYPHKQRITAISIEDAASISLAFPGVRFVRIETGRPLPFADRRFDLAFCNAVLEHVGGPEKQLKFIREVVRISKRGLIATPYRYFPIEAHTAMPLLHWLPRAWHRKIISGLGFKEFATEDQLHLLDVREFQSLFPRKIRLQVFFSHIFGWPANIIGVYWNAG